MFELLTKTVKLSNGRNFTVAENDWIASRQLHRLIDTASASFNGDNSAFGFFCKNIYPLLAATAKGDVPDAATAFGLPREELDAWYLDVWRLNADWIPLPLRDEPMTEDVTFRDGSTITISESRDLPSFLLRLVELEDDATRHPDPEEDVQVFKLSIYPKMAAGVISGSVPPAEEVVYWPSAERNKWYEAATRMNQDWFAPLNVGLEEYQRAQAEKEKKDKKKKVKQPNG